MKPRGTDLVGYAVMLALFIAAAVLLVLDLRHQPAAPSRVGWPPPTSDHPVPPPP